MTVEDFSITKEWLQRVIQRSGRHGHGKQVTVCSFTAVRALPKGENYVSVPVRCSVVYIVQDEVEERRLDLFIKVKPTGEEHRAMSDAIGAFVREAEVYNDLIPEMRAVVDSAGAPKSCYPDVPKCVFATRTDEDDQDAIVMEDLSIFGYKLANRFEGATRSEVELILKAFAKFHALGIEVARKMGSSYWEEPRSKYANLFSDPFTCEFIMEALGDNSIFNNMEEALRRHSSDDAVLLADKLRHYMDVTCGGKVLQRFAALGKKVTNEKFTGFRLGDCWLNNMLFRYDVQEDGSQKPVAIKLLDLQITQAGSLLVDLNYFFGSSTPNEIFSKRQELIRTIYYPELFRILSLLKSPLSAADYPFGDFWQDFQQEYGEYCLISAMFVLPIVMAEREQVPDIDSGADMSVDDFKTMNKGVLESKSSRKIMDRFAHILRTIVEENIIQ